MKQNRLVFFVFCFVNYLTETYFVLVYNFFLYYVNSFSFSYIYPVLGRRVHMKVWCCLSQLLMYACLRQVPRKFVKLRAVNISMWCILNGCGPVWSAGSESRSVSFLSKRTITNHTGIYLSQSLSLFSLSVCPAFLYP